MTSVAFDMLRFVRALREKAKLISEQAEGLAEAMQQDGATKSDLRETEQRLLTAVAASKTEVFKWLVYLAMALQVVVIGVAAAWLRIAVHWRRTGEALTPARRPPGGPR